MIDVTGEIYAVAERYLEKVRPSGPENVMALCPFHGESNPSFSMNIVNGVYFCHTCHARGTLRSFLRRVGVGPEAIRLRYAGLIEEAQKHMPKPPDPLRPGVFDMVPIEEGLLGLFDYTPPSLLEAGFAEATLKYFEVGYDRWHNRITFPIRDLAGKLVGISGRALDHDVKPRYKIYDKEYTTWGLPPRIGWNKRAVLYNAHNVYPTAVFSNPNALFLATVEGFKACMWLYQAGVTNVVGLLGSYLSWEQQWILERLGAPVYLFLDNNSAGVNGTLKADASLMRSLETMIVEYPERLLLDDNAQPDSCTPDEVFVQVHSAVPMAVWLERRLGEVAR